MKDKVLVVIDYDLGAEGCDYITTTKEFAARIENIILKAEIEFYEKNAKQYDGIYEAIGEALKVAKSKGLDFEYIALKKVIVI